MAIEGLVVKTIVNTYPGFPSKAMCDALAQSQVAALIHQGIEQILQENPDGDQGSIAPPAASNWLG